MSVIRKYRFPTLAAYFEHQRDIYGGTGASRYTTTDDVLDTHERFAKRVGCSTSTIARVSAGLFDPSFKLAIAIAREADCPVDGMGKSGVKE